MSYILDALRRADAERQQGHVPGLHATPAADLPQAQRRAWSPLARLLALGVLLATAGLALLWFWPAPPASPSAPVQAAVQPLPPVAAPPQMPAAALPIVVSAAPAAPATPASTVATPQAKPADAGAAPAATLPVVPKPAAAPAVRALPLASLPPDERRQLPPLVQGGSVWSDSAASRFVILDGQVLREGDPVAPGVVLERIERKAAVLRWKDQRIEVPL
jgi:general secretion pathway protein B